MKKVTFVILHYVAIKDTIECIESIFNNINYKNYNIIVVDNNSPNKSGEKLQKIYGGRDGVEIVINEKNLGFANGNNIGYDIAKNKYKSDFIIIINNDTIIEQSNFIDLIINSFSDNKFFVLGPDILTCDGVHQNPQRLNGMSKIELKKAIKYTKKQYYKVLVMDKLKLYEILKKIKSKVVKNEIINKSENKIFYNNLLEGVQLHGACIVFSSKFIKKYNFAFYPKTFMYGEEDILHYICEKNKYKIIYDPRIKIYHKEDASTNMILNSTIKKRKFILKHSLDSLKLLDKIVEKGDLI